MSEEVNELLGSCIAFVFVVLSIAFFLLLIECVSAGREVVAVE